MIVSSADVVMRSSRFAQSRRETLETLRIESRRPVAISQPRDGVPEAGTSGNDARTEDAAALSPDLELLKRIVERMLGREIRLFRLETRPASTGGPGVDASMRAQSSGAVVEYQRVDRILERERTEFSAAGIVRLEDGREIGLAVNMTMQRFHEQETRVAFSTNPGQRTDPLMPNLDGGPVHLSDIRFSFDLRGDGERENVPLPGEGSWTLALDRNGNGSIDSGRELFGPVTGNGFAELAALDVDGNGWVDGADAGFGSLMLWRPDAEGGGRLVMLAESGIGAIQTEALATPFSLRDADNGELGMVRSSSVYLTENGDAGVLQQVDLTV